jgi:hypothetical protein
VLSLLIMFIMISLIIMSTSFVFKVVSFSAKSRLCDSANLSVLNNVIILLT